jgi:hypothetical protein
METTGTVQSEIATTYRPQSQVPAENGAFPFKPESVYGVLGTHQIHEQTWPLRDTLAWLQLWAGRMNEDFGLGLSEVSFCVDWLSARRLGHYRPGTNGFGLRGEVALNERYLHRREPWQLLGTLLHELLHAWQDVFGKPGKHNYHNKQLREKAYSLGLVIDTKGHTQYLPKSRFFEFLNRFGVETPQFPPRLFVERGESNLKKWCCQCKPPINVRVAVPHFYSRCLWCGAIYERKD